MTDEEVHVLTLIKTAGDTRTLNWRGFRHVEQLRRDLFETTSLSGGNWSDVTQWGPKRLSDLVWLRNCLDRRRLWSLARKSHPAYDVIPWEIHDIEDLTAYLSALAAYKSAI